MDKKIIREGTFQTEWNKEKMLYEENVGRNATATHDPNAICFEIYNKSGFDIEMQSQRKEDLGTKYFKFIVKNDEFHFVPHGYYIIRGLERNGKSYLPNGTQLTILKNYGDQRFIGNKKASLNTTVMK